MEDFCDLRLRTLKFRVLFQWGLKYDPCVMENTPLSAKKNKGKGKENGRWMYMKIEAVTLVFCLIVSWVEDV